MIDLQSLKEQVDLLALASRDTTLRRVASSGGGEWAGPCPFCGGSDRFRVQPSGPGGGRWLCRHCTDGKWQDALAYGQRMWPGEPFAEVCARLAGGKLPERQGRGAPARPPAPAYRAPEGDWQSQARRAVERCSQSLWSKTGRHALDYLLSRGLSDETLRHWEIGYSQGENFGDLWVPRGVLLPCRALGQIWYLKVSLLPGQMVRCERCRLETPARKPCTRCGAVNKYRGVKGNRPAAVWGADELPGAQMALFVEGEFDALVAWQELHDVVAVCTLGSATNQPDLATWGAFIAPVELILAAYDADGAGQRGMQALQGMSARVRPCPLPEGAKDINELFLAGKPLWPWLKERLQDLGVVE